MARTSSLNGSQAVGTPVVNLDKLTYAGNLQNLASVERNPAYHFEQGDICEPAFLDRLLDRYQPRAILHFAAESHVDRSICGPEAFIRTNIDGTFRLLEATRAYLTKSSTEDRRKFRFLHVSTDEVYGSLRPQAPPFEETTAYPPNSPYSPPRPHRITWCAPTMHTYGSARLTTNCSNNYGPFQFPEKLIPLMILNALAGKPLPIYGDGRTYATGSTSAITATPCERCWSGDSRRDVQHRRPQREANLDTIELLCSLLDELLPGSPHVPHRLITFVNDRPGHDRRYAINAAKIERELGWRPAETFASGLRRTVEWYLAIGLGAAGDQRSLSPMDRLQLR